MQKVCCEIVMVTTDPPVTRSELKEELALLRDEFRQHYATKADLKELEVRLMLRLGGLMITGFALVIGAMRLWA